MAQVRMILANIHSLFSYPTYNVRILIPHRANEVVETDREADAVLACSRPVFLVGIVVRRGRSMSVLIVQFRGMYSCGRTTRKVHRRFNNIRSFTHLQGEKGKINFGSV